MLGEERKGLGERDPASLGRRGRPAPVLPPRRAGRGGTGRSEEGEGENTPRRGTFSFVGFRPPTAEATTDDRPGGEGSEPEHEEEGDEHEGPRESRREGKPKRSP